MIYRFKTADGLWCLQEVPDEHPPQQFVRSIAYQHNPLSYMTTAVETRSVAKIYYRKYKLEHDSQGYFYREVFDPSFPR